MSTLKTTNIQHPSAASPAVELTAAGGLWLGGGKILQVVRATDSTRRTTTSSSYVDTNMSITITPTAATSAIIIVVSVWNETTSGDTSKLIITDSSNNSISGAEELGLYHGSTGLLEVMTTGFAYSTPATTSATTYKVRFLNSGGGTHTIYNDLNTGQMYAIEVSA
jgi:hypothetical protein